MHSVHKSLQLLTVQEKAVLYRQIATDTHRDIDGRIWHDLASLYEALAEGASNTSHVRLRAILDEEAYM